MAAHTTTSVTLPPTADSLERSLRSFSICDSGLCQTITTTRHAQESETDSDFRQHDLITLDLNSDAALPYNWEQCLDLKTGEIYFLNRSNGVKTKEDPREMAEYRGMYYYSDDEEEDDDDDSCDYETDEEGCGLSVVKGGCMRGDVDEENVLVAAGCRSCLMYYMVPKQVNDCPKCNRQLLHFDRLEKSSSPTSV